MAARAHKTRILWVTFDFPPRISSGVFRPIKIYKYLDKRTFEVDFVTHGPAPRFKRSVLDDSLLADVHPQPAIHRVSTVILHDLLPQLAARLRRRRVDPAATTPAAGPPAAAESARTVERTGGRGLFRAIYRWFALSTYFPDHLFLWGWSAAFKSLRLHLRRRYDVIYTTSFPESAHLAGVLLSACGVKWVVDYRYGGPLWIKDIVGFRKPWLRERLDHLYQRWVLRRADCVIAQSEQIRADFCRVFGLDPSRVLVIPSGYDEADFGTAIRSPAPFAGGDADVHLLHVGTLEGVGERERGLLLDSLNALSGALHDRGYFLKVHAVGSDLFRPDQSGRIRFAYTRYGVVVHRDVPSYLRAADCYLLSTLTTSHGDVQGFIPSKVWEYLRAGRPILTVGPKDEVWRILEEAGVGLQMSLSGGDASARDLADRLVRQVRTQRPLHASVSRHSWESRARQLQMAFHDLVPASASGRRGEALA
jgi:glycosyltransferase involved in cell wall biosynthesis